MADLERAAWILRAVDAYEGRLLRYAAELVGPQLAKDVVQDTFERLCDVPNARAIEHLAAWLFTVCRNRAFDLRRRARPVASLEAHAELTDEATAPADVHLSRAQAVVHLRRLMAALPERERELIRLRFDCELSYKEIAEVMGLSVSNVGFLLHHAVRHMRDALAAWEGARGQARLGRTP